MIQDQVRWEFRQDVRNVGYSKRFSRSVSSRILSRRQELTGLILVVANSQVCLQSCNPGIANIGAVKESNEIQGCIDTVSLVAEEKGT